jgi:hypothetical protein
MCGRDFTKFVCGHTTFTGTTRNTHKCPSTPCNRKTPTIKCCSCRTTTWKSDFAAVEQYDLGAKRNRPPPESQRISPHHNARTWCFELSKLLCCDTHVQLITTEFACLSAFHTPSHAPPYCQSMGSNLKASVYPTPPALPYTSQHRFQGSGLVL